ncbi:MAG: sigma-70 family RNA polymerase sigma factor [Thermoanaerobaculia bacterium]|nr:sigma-70 family RNA polymerase sigma factor [Thermoanaerobaculia bacterium]
MNDLDLLQAGYRFALSLTGNPAEADDLAQQGWLRLHKCYGARKGRGALFTTIRRLFIDRYRRDRRVELVAIEDLDLEPEDIAMPRTERIDLERLLVSLREKEREVLFLHAVEGYTAAEIATLTEQSRGTVLSLIQRARRKLAAGATSTTVAEPAG